MTAACMANNFACNCIFLGRESERSKGGELDLSGVGSGCGERL